MTDFNDLPVVSPDDPALQGGVVDEMARRYIARVWTLENALTYHTFPPPRPIASEAEWGVVQSSFTGMVHAQQSTPSGNPYLWWPLPGLVGGRRIHSALINLKGASVHATSGGAEPQLQMFRVNASTGAVSEIGTIDVDNTNVGTYDDVHVLGINGLGASGPLVGTDSCYYLRIKGEGDSGGGIAGLEVYGARIVLVDPNFDPA